MQNEEKPNDNQSEYSLFLVAVPDVVVAMIRDTNALNAILAAKLHFYLADGSGKELSFQLLATIPLGRAEVIGAVFDGERIRKVKAPPENTQHH